MILINFNFSTVLHLKLLSAVLPYNLFDCIFLCEAGGNSINLVSLKVPWQGGQSSGLQNIKKN